MSIIYSCNKKLLRASAREQKKDIPFDMSLYYSNVEINQIQAENADWFENGEWLCGSSQWFIPHCAWCYGERSELGEENEHTLCDARLYYHTEEGKAEQAQLLAAEIFSKAPSTVIAMIMSYAV